MTRKRRLTISREDADALIGAGQGGRQQEGGLRQVGPPRKRSHSLLIKVGGIMHHGQGLPLSGIAENTST